jgi:deoxyribodipyrimidine photolyase
MAEKNVQPKQLGAEDFLPSDIHLSPYLRFGCLSPRHLYHCIGSIFKKVRVHGANAD